MSQCRSNGMSASFSLKISTSTPSGHRPAMSSGTADCMIDGSLMRNRVGCVYVLITAIRMVNPLLSCSRVLVSVSNIRQGASTHLPMCRIARRSGIEAPACPTESDAYRIARDECKDQSTASSMIELRSNRIAQMPELGLRADRAQVPDEPDECERLEHVVGEVQFPPEEA